MRLVRQPGYVCLATDSPCGLTFTVRRQPGIVVLSACRRERTLAAYLCRL